MGTRTAAQAPQLAGNSNLYCQCMVRAVVAAQFAESGMLPVLHVQTTWKQKTAEQVKLLSCLCIF
eukprot:3338822-Pleurochrysis_carterae.AAC.2